ncbi:hypothetical protein Anas_01153, partial [Armadillidium nasatum]
FLSQSDRGETISKVLVLVLSVLFAFMGLIMIVVGATSYKSLKESGDTYDRTSTYITILCIGTLFEIIAIGALILYYRHIGYYIPCCPGKIARIRKHLQESRIVGKVQYGKTGQPVSAQYCPPAPPSVGSSPPAPYTDISEQQRLMEEKQENGDDTERILEEDPRIVLTPLKNHEEC